MDTGRTVRIASTVYIQVSVGGGADNTWLTSDSETFILRGRRRPHLGLETGTDQRQDRRGVAEARAELFAVVDREVIGWFSGRRGHEAAGVGGRGEVRMMVKGVGDGGRWAHQPCRFAAAATAAAAVDIWTNIFRLLSFQQFQVALHLLHWNLDIDRSVNQSINRGC